MELSIDTSNATASIALSESGDVIAELTWRAGYNHTVELLPNIDHLMDGIDRSEIDAVIVAIGPGSFNGLRVGLATAKGLAVSLNSSIVGISTLEMEAYRHALHTEPICPIFNAGRGEIAAALFQNKDGNWKRIMDEHITTLDELCARLKTRTVFCGQIPDETAAEITKHMGDRAVVARGAHLLRRAGYLAELGWRRISTGDTDNPDVLQPLYLRKPAITQKKKNFP